MDEPLQDGQPPKINGSIMMAEADTVEEVWKWVRNDIYYTTGVWDIEKVRVVESGSPRAMRNMRADK